MNAIWTMTNNKMKVHKKLVGVIYSKLDISTRISSYHLLPRSPSFYNLNQTTEKKKRGKEKEEMLQSISNFAALCFRFPSRCLLCAGSFLPDSHCDSQCARRLVRDAFYMLQLAFSLLPTAATIPESCHAH